MFPDVRQVRWSTIALFVVLHEAFKAFVFSEAFGRFSAPVFAATRGVITYELTAYLIEFALLGAVVLLAREQLRFRDIGLVGAHLPKAVLVIGILWGVVQYVILGIEAVEGRGLRLHPDFRLYPMTMILGKTLEAPLGSALFEEVVYRGFLLPQLFLKLDAWRPGRPEVNLACAVGITQLYFGLNHLPVGLTMDLTTSGLLIYLLQMVLGGVLFAAIFLRTGNLFLSIGVHALLNNPVALFGSTIDPALLVLIFSCLLLLLWPTCARLWGGVFTLRPALSRSGSI